MGRAIRWTVEKILQIEEYERLKPEYFEIYRAGYYHPEVQDRTPKSNSQLIIDSIEAGTEALQFDPHAAINTANNTYTLVMLILSVFGFILESLNIAINLFIIPNSEINQMVRLAIGGIPGYVPLLIAIYLWLVSRDTELVQEMNDYLRIPPGKVKAAERNTELLFCYMVWNSSLSSNTKLPVMSFLILIRMLRESWYQWTMKIIREHFEELYQANNRREAIRILYPGVRNAISGRCH